MSISELTASAESLKPTARRSRAWVADRPAPAGRDAHAACMRCRRVVDWLPQIGHVFVLECSRRSCRYAAQPPAGAGSPAAQAFCDQVALALVALAGRECLVGVCGDRTSAWTRATTTPPAKRRAPPAATCHTSAGAARRSSTVGARRPFPRAAGSSSARSPGYNAAARC